MDETPRAGPAPGRDLARDLAGLPDGWTRASDRALPPVFAPVHCDLCDALEQELADRACRPLRAALPRPPRFLGAWR
jgi:hypothetical protein